MKKEKSCGCIIIKDNQVLLIFEKRRQYWGFPKGHVEQNETEIETATREVKEEVGLNVVIDPEKRYEMNYIIKDKIEKYTIYFLAMTDSKNIVLQGNEIEDAKWCNFEDALMLLTFDGTKDILRQVIKDI